MSSELLSEDEKASIRRRLPMLQRCISFGTNLKATLRQKNVIDSRQIQQLECQACDVDKVRYLVMEVICRGPRWKYDKLEETFIGLRMSHVVDILQGQYDVDDWTPPTVQRNAEDIRPLTDEEKQRIQGNMSHLTRLIVPGCFFMAHLNQAGIMDERQRQLFTCSKMTSADKIRAILTQIILNGPKWKYDAFMEALRYCDMGYVVDCVIFGDVDQGEGAVCRDDVDGGDLRRVTPEDHQRLLDGLPLLVESFGPSPLFWAKIRQKKIITTQQIEVLCQNNHPGGQILGLMFILLRGAKRNLKAFYEVLQDCDMGHLIPTGANESPSGRLWDRAAEENQCSLSESERTTLKSHTTLFSGNMCLGELTWAFLLHYRVVDVSKKEEIEGGSDKPDWERKTDLVLHVLRCPRWAYHGFLCTLVCTGQEHLVMELGANPSSYT